MRKRAAQLGISNVLLGIGVLGSRVAAAEPVTVPPSALRSSKNAVVACAPVRDGYVEG